MECAAFNCSIKWIANHSTSDLLKHLREKHRKEWAKLQAQCDREKEKQLEEKPESTGRCVALFYIFSC